MNDLAYNPESGAISRAAGNVGSFFSPTMDKYRDPESYSPSWKRDYTRFFWIRMGILLVMLGVPVVFVGFTLLSLLGYGALAAIPVLTRQTKKNISDKWTCRQAYMWYCQLDQTWKEHADIFYRQIWNHGCSGDRHKHDYSCDYGVACKGRVSGCNYCNRRLTEIAALVDSKKSLENKSTSETDKIIFEASEQFRKAIADQSKPSEIMKEISSAAHAS